MAFWMFIKMPLYINCKICNKEIRVYPYQIKKNKQFCSIECHRKHVTLHNSQNQANIVKERFIKNIEISKSGCWLWKKCKDRDGYGVMFDTGKYKTAHRYSWELHNGKIPYKNLVCHKCDVRHCVNPEHLFLGTCLDNNKDRKQKGRNNHVVGEKCPMTKLTEKNVIKIRNRLKNGELIINIASEFNVHVNTISRLKHYKSWSHI